VPTAVARSQRLDAANMPEQLTEASNHITNMQPQSLHTPTGRDDFHHQNSVGQSSQDSSASSSLTSAPSTVGSTPEGLSDRSETQPREQSGATRAGSPTRRPKHDRKATQRHIEHGSDRSASSGAKRRKVGLCSTKGSPGTLTAVSLAETPQSKDTLTPASSNGSRILRGTTLPTASPARCQAGQNSSSNSREPQIVIRESNSRSQHLQPKLAKSAAPKYARIKDDEALEADIASAFLAKTQHRTFEPRQGQDQIDQYLRRFPASTAPPGGLDHEGWKCDEMYPGFDRRNPTYYHADGITKTASSNTGQPGSNRDSEAPSPSAKGGKGSNLGKGGKSHGKNGKPNKGRIGGAGGGRDRDSPEPPNKTPMTQEDKRLLAHIRARQAELRRFYATVVVQQRDALEMTTSRDLTRLLKKQNAHTKVQEFQEVVAQLQQKEQYTTDVINKEYEFQVALAEEWKKAQEDIIESQMQRRVLISQEEHAKGAQGDLIIFHKAHRAAGDETKTDNGSDLEDYLPRYHEMPEPDTGPRGYDSSRIIDEKSFKEHLASYDDQAQREVIEDDIVGPVQQSVAEHNARQAAEEERKVRFESLVSVAKGELEEKGGYLIPRPLRPSENPQFALSRLADCAEYISRAHPTQAYVFMPVAPRDMASFPRHHLERVPPPNHPEKVPPTPTFQPKSSTPRRTIARRNKSLSVPVKRHPRDEEPQSQSSSDTSTPLPAIAPAPSRMPPPPMASQHHHHYSLSQQMPPATVSALPPAPPSHPAPLASTSRPPSLTPLIPSRQSLSHTSPPATPTTGHLPIMPIHGVPPQPPQPGPFRPGPMLAQYGPPLLQLGQYPPLGAYQPRNSFPPPIQQTPRVERPPLQSPVESTTPVDQPQHRFSISSSTQGPPKPRLGGPRRAPGEITFTNVQTPDSERFRSPSQPPPNQPGQAVLRPGTAPNTPNGLGTGKIANTFVNAAPDANSRSQQAADAARQNATINAVQGAGPKGGRRVLLPKGHSRY